MILRLTVRLSVFLQAEWMPVLVDCTLASILDVVKPIPLVTQFFFCRHDPQRRPLKQGNQCTLVVQVQQSVQSVQSVRCVRLFVRTITVDRNDLWPTYIFSILVHVDPRSSSKVKVRVQGHRMKNSFFGYGCTFWRDVYILNRQTAAPSVHNDIYTINWLSVHFVVLK